MPLRRTYLSLLLFLLFLAPLGQLKAQLRGEVNETVPTRGIGIGIHAHTYGFGFEVQYYLLRDNSRTLTIGTSLSSTKHPQESKINSAFSDQGGKNYIFDKKNYAYVLAPTIGFGKDIIPRNDFNKINLRLTTSVGPALAMLKPYYLDIAVPISGTSATIATQAYDPALHNYGNIYGESDYFTGMNEITFVPGLQGKIAAMLDLAGNRNVIRGIEFTLYGNYFVNKLDLLGNTDNKQFWIGGSAAFIVGNTW